MARVPACDRRPPGAFCYVCDGGDAGGDPWYCEVAPPDDEPTVGGGGAALVPGYAIRGLLGAGGMGAVYLAESEAHGWVALKVITSEPGSDAARRFRRESEGLASLALPGVVRVLDRGSEGELHWLVMEWIRGPSLYRVLQERGALPEAEAVRIVASIARTLGAVHAAGLAHRDVKPSNILLRPDGTPILADFGILRHLDDLQRTTLTQHPVGTPAYMAPELLKTGDVDWVRADLYALGVVAVRCLSGQVPKGAWDLEGVPERLRPALAQAMAERPADRPADAFAFADALERTTPPSRRNAALIGLSTASILFTTVGAAAIVLANPTLPDVSASFAPVAVLIDEGRRDDADRVLALALEDADPAEADALWLARARKLDDTEAWGLAWDQVGDAWRPRALRGLRGALHREGRFTALDVLLRRRDPAVLDPTGALRAEVDAYQWRFAASARAAPEPFVPVLGILAGIDPAPHPGTPTPQGWWCTDDACRMGDRVTVPPGGFRVVPGEREYLWGNGWVEAIDGSARCDVDLGVPFTAVAWNGQVVLGTTGDDPQLHLLEMEGCRTRLHPDHAAWRGSYLKFTTGWDADGDGVEELVVLVGPPFGYEMRLYDRDDGLLASLPLGGALHAGPFGGDLVVVTGATHGNAALFDFPEVGAYRIHWTGSALEIVEDWPGEWWQTEAADLAGDGRETLFLTGPGETRVQVPGVPLPIRLAPFEGLGVPSDLDGDGADELAVRVDGEGWILGGRGSADIGRPAAVLPAHTGDTEVDRALDLAGLGMPLLGARQLAVRALARSGDRAALAWSEAARLFEEGGDGRGAMEAWAAAARAGRADAWDAAVGLAIRSGEMDRAAALLAELPPGVAVSEAWTRAVESRLTEDFATAPRGWGLRAPLASWSADRSRLRFRSLGAPGVVAELPIVETGSARGLRADLRIDRLEFGADVRIELVDAADEVVAFARIRSGGSRGALFRSITPDVDLNLPVFTSDPAASQRVAVTLALDGGTLRFTSEEGERVEQHVVSSGSDAPIRALRVRMVGMDGAMADVALEGLSLWGVARDGPRELPAGAPGLADALTTTALRTTPSLEPVVAGDPERLRLLEHTYALAWRMHRSESGLQDRVLDVPGLDDPAVWRASPDLALMRAEMLLAVGRPAEARAPLAAIPAEPRCVRRAALLWAADQAVGDGPGVEAARRELASCGANEIEIRTELWWLGLADQITP